MTSNWIPAGAAAWLAALATALPAQESAAWFDTPSVEVGPQHRFERVLDLDGDGDSDAIGWWWVDDHFERVWLRAYLDVGLGQPAWSWALGVDVPDMGAGAYASESAVGDLDADGSDDFVLAFEELVVAYLSNGGSFPLEVANLTQGGRVQGLAVEDFDGDGAPDLAVLTTVLRLYQNDGTGSSFALADEIPIGAGAKGLAALEFDAVAGLDLAVGLPGAIGVVGVSAANFGTTQSFPHQVGGAGEPTAGDVDGDGDTDVVVFGPTSYQLLRNTGAGSFAVEPQTAGGPATDLVDVDADGDLDGACCGSGCGSCPDPTFNTASSRFEIALNQGGGAFDESYSIQGLGAHHLAGAVDVDADGDVDLVGGRCIYWNRTPGHLATDPTPELVLPAGVPGPVPQAIRDFDDDGDVDLEFGLGTTQAGLGDGSTELAGLVVEPPPPGHTYLGPGFPGDFTGDGRVDLIVSMGDAAGFVSMRLLVNNGGGGLVDGGDAAAPGVTFNISHQSAPLLQPGAAIEFDQPWLSVTGDVDLDGDTDLIVNEYIGDTGHGSGWEVWENDGTGFFTKLVTSLGGTVLAVHDLDHQGLADLIVLYGGFGGSDIKVFYPQSYPGIGLGTQLFGHWDIDEFADHVAIADLDGDGDVDIASSGSYEDRRGVSWNDGSGSFTWQSFPAAGLDLDIFPDYDSSVSPKDQRHGVFPLDVDGDGLNDLLLGPARSDDDQHAFSDADGANHFYVLLKRAGEAGWDLAGEQMLDPRTLADVDGDGDLDLLGRDVIRLKTYNAPENGIRLQYGTSKPGTGGMAPVLGMKGPVHAGSIPQMRLRGAVGGATTFLVVSGLPADLPGYVSPDSGLWVDPNFLFVLPIPAAGAPGVAGAGEWTVPIGVDPAMAGLEVYHQVGAVDPGAPFGLTLTNGLKIRYGE